uniref:Putative retroelement pol polyprotein n=1 Tax=Albugo laibachii Nc14 TaxID=890382 RepID=F0WZE7_9STRA|nr:putative retroelement pol polyprotein [Albugo laibachii Nc14]|eukprot:CCA26867.1 putative retroelement pol polyprotein [Albugo laibachii Nc14]
MDSREDEQERIIYHRVTINAVETQKKTEIEPIGLELSSSGSDMPAQSRLLVRDSVIGNKSVKILIDTGASTNLIKPGLASKARSVQKVQARRFDGTWTSSQTTKRVQDTILMEGMEFPKMQFTEWDRPDTHDLIFGQPWFTKYNSQIDWRTQQIEVADHTKFEDVDGPTFQDKMKSGAYDEIYQLKVTNVEPSEIPQELNPVLDEYKDSFLEQLPDEMPLTRSVNFELQMKPDAVLSSRAPFRISKVEQDALQQFVEENIRKGWIEESKSPWVSNIFGIPKKDPATGEFPKRAEWLRSGDSKIPIRWVIDYRYVNSMSIVAKIPLLLIEELIDRMVGCKYFTLLDLAQGYHQMVVLPSSRPYTAFRTQKEMYQWCVAPLGLSGMPGAWSRLMRTLFDKLRKFVVVRLDDICILSRTMEFHVKDVRAVCEVLRKDKLYARLSKCAFGLKEIAFLGHMVSEDGIRVDLKKTDSIATFQAPTCCKKLLSFLGLAGHYRRFICNFAQISCPLRDSTNQDTQWNWGEDQQKAFNALKLALQQSPTLKLPDFTHPFIVITDVVGSAWVLFFRNVSTTATTPLRFIRNILAP